MTRSLRSAAIANWRAPFNRMKNFSHRQVCRSGGSFSSDRCLLPQVETPSRVLDTPDPASRMPHLILAESRRVPRLPASKPIESAAGGVPCAASILSHASIAADAEMVFPSASPRRTPGIAPHARPTWSRCNSSSPVPISSPGPRVLSCRTPRRIPKDHSPPCGALQRSAISFQFEIRRLACEPAEALRVPGP